MSCSKRLALKATIALCLSIAPVQALSQSPTAPLKSITEDQFLKAISLIRPAPETKKLDDGSYEIILPNGIPANAQLQNCEDKKTLSNCRTLSIIVNLQKPKGKNRADSLRIANEFNKNDIHGRSFVDEENDIITRFAFFVTGHEPSTSLATKLINWDAFVRSAVLSLHGDNDTK
ncbi:YbjN domain-containing protein [Tsuneonella sp. SYSU-LHT278]|uniref:YbjN domain-containing protein n=1 Tax=Tsuneonella sediminis TaxID=3416089 RepID=UPI003F792D00